MSMLRFYFIVFSVAAISSCILTLLVRKFALKLNLLDQPSKRKVHTKAVPTLGGIALYCGFNLAMGAAFFLDPVFVNDFSTAFVGISIASGLVIACGVYDDLYDLSAYKKLMIQILAVIVLIVFGFEINVLTKPLGGGLPLGFLSVFITVIWILGMINAINLLDGLDGLAAGVSGIALMFLFLAALKISIFPVAVLCICLLGAIAGFLPFNFYPAKIFMGNTGSMFLGLIVAVIALAGFQKRTAIFTLFVPLMAIALPIIDTGLSIIRRLLKGNPVFKADREHIHHKLFNIEKSQARAVLSLYFITFCFGLIALSFSRLEGIYAIVALVIVVLVTLRWLKNWGFLKFK